MRILILLMIWAAGLAYASVQPAVTSPGSTAATATALNNTLCTAIQPFYAEIGTNTGTQWSVVSPAGETTWTATTLIGVDSASKWQYAELVAGVRGGLTGLSAADIAALNQTDGYANMVDSTTTNDCVAPGNSPNFSCGASAPGTANSPQYCANQCGVDGVHTNIAQQPTACAPGMYCYNGGHFQRHAVANNTALIAQLDISVMYAQYAAVFAAVSGWSYAPPYQGAKIQAPGGAFTEPLIAGGISQTPTHYAQFLQMILNSETLASILAGGNIAGNYVCAWSYTGGCSTAYYSPITEKWDYAIGHWWEVDPANNNDWSVSSPGAAGFYPWITPLCGGALCTSQSAFNTAYTTQRNGIWAFYGLIGRHATPSGETGAGQLSQKCAQVIRKAWVTGVQQ